MGYAVMIGVCCACHCIMQFNPHLVPSLGIDGVRMPLCKECANRWNEIHPDNKRPIHPKAYEFFDEEEL